MTTSSITYLFLLSVITEAYEPNSITMERKNYYCEYCGKKFPDVRTLTSGTCTYHPDGSNKGRHKLYEGTEKPPTSSIVPPPFQCLSPARNVEA